MPPAPTASSKRLPPELIEALRALESLGGRETVSADELYHADFIKRRTNGFNSLDDWLAASPVAVRERAVADLSPEERAQWEGFVAESTRFVGWDEMRFEAVRDRARRRNDDVLGSLPSKTRDQIWVRSSGTPTFAGAHRLVVDAEPDERADAPGGRRRRPRMGRHDGESARATRRRQRHQRLGQAPGREAAERLSDELVFEVSTLARDIGYMAEDPARYHLEASKGAIAGAAEVANAFSFGVSGGEQRQELWSQTHLEGSVSQSISVGSAQGAREAAITAASAGTAQLAAKGVTAAKVATPFLNAYEAYGAYESGQVSVEQFSEGNYLEGSVAAVETIFAGIGLVESASEAAKSVRKAAQSGHEFLLETARENVRSPSLGMGAGGFGGGGKKKPKVSPKKRTKKKAKGSEKPERFPIIKKPSKKKAKKKKKKKSATRDPGGRPGTKKHPGTWIEEKGQEYFIPDHPEKYGLKPGDRVPYTGKEADFSQWAIDEFEVPGMDGGSGDRNKAFGVMLKRELNNGGGRFKTIGDVQAWARKNDYRVHHVPRSSRIQILPRIVHELPHRGGASYLKRRNRKKARKRKR
ncbi:hypothetical protein Pan216_11580 [Planctomycetes bacterium Pan216]|uniref:Uncharacterized protein n=1 Tax=Kolteria novifilia TaxID=2527975 RepID=A0A518B010_9BACT|nr:hypothetical protein Pan216_11580 [Planctomycetes bacterium Pan216]